MLHSADPEASSRGASGRDPLALGWSLVEQGSFAGALAPAREAIESGQELGMAYALLAVALVATGERAEGLEAARQAVARAPSNPYLHSVLALTHEALGCHDEAEGSLQEALRLDASAAYLHLLLGELCLARGRWAEALMRAEEGLALEPDSFRALELRQQAMARLAPVEQATDAREHTERGWELLGHRQPILALASFETALRLDVRESSAREGLISAVRAAPALYRAHLGLRLALANVPPRARVVALIGVVLGSRLLLDRAHSQAGWWLCFCLGCVALYEVVMSLVDPFFNALLRSQANGYQALGPRPLLAADLWLALLAAASGVGLEAWVVQGDRDQHAWLVGYGALACLALAGAVGYLLELRNDRGRQLSALLLVAAVVLAPAAPALAPRSLLLSVGCAGAYFLAVAMVVWAASRWDRRTDGE